MVFSSLKASKIWDTKELERKRREQEERWDSVRENVQRGSRGRMNIHYATHRMAQVQAQRMANVVESRRKQLHFSEQPPKFGEQDEGDDDAEIESTGSGIGRARSRAHASAGPPARTQACAHTPAPDACTPVCVGARVRTPPELMHACMHAHTRVHGA